jgi:hypothetical protein
LTEKARFVFDLLKNHKPNLWDGQIGPNPKHIHHRGKLKMSSTFSAAAKPISRLALYRNLKLNLFED